MTIKFKIPNCEHCESRCSSIFNELKDVQLEEISSNKGCNLYKKGQIVFYEGSRPTGLYCVNRGKVKISKLRTEGKEQIVRLAKQGDILGYRALIGSDLYTASAEALDNSLICYIPKELVFNMIIKNSDISLKLMELLATDLKKSEEHMANLAQKHVRERLAETLLMLKATYGMEQDDKTISISLSREDLANIVGTATETLIRILSDFKEDKIIAIKGRRIEVLNNYKLINIANIYDSV